MCASTSALTPPTSSLSPSAFRAVSKICPVAVTSVPPAMVSSPPVTWPSASGSAKEKDGNSSVPPLRVTAFLMFQSDVTFVTPSSCSNVPRKPSMAALKSRSPSPLLFTVGLASAKERGSSNFTVPAPVTSRCEPAAMCMAFAPVESVFPRKRISCPMPGFRVTSYRLYTAPPSPSALLPVKEAPPLKRMSPSLTIVP